MTRDAPDPIERIVAERAEKDRAAMAEEARRFDENLESHLDDFEKAVALMGAGDAPDPTINSSMVNLRSPTANMYGCEPCPKCRNKYRCVFQDKPNIIQCDDCGFHEEITERIG
jgi:hypothetical protein